MSDVWLGRLNRFVEKLFNVKGGPTVVSIEPSVRVDLPWQSGVEDRLLQGWNRFAATANAAANAAQSGGTRIRNPGGSNMMLVIERVLMHNGVTTTSFFNITQGPATTDLATIETGFRIDSRGSPNSVAIISLQNTTPANLSSTMVVAGVNNLGRDLINNPNQEWNLLPGEALQIVDNTVNEQLVVTWTWRERPMESSEFLA